MDNYLNRGPLKVSPYLLPNLCANLPAGKAGMLMGFTGPIFSPQGACASGNHAIGIGARMIRDGDCDFVARRGGGHLPGPRDHAGLRQHAGHRLHHPAGPGVQRPHPGLAPVQHRPQGHVLSEGAGVLVLAAEEALATYGLEPKAEVMGIGWTSDAHHFTAPNPQTIVRAIREAIDDAGLAPGDIGHVNAHGTSTPKGDKVEVECLREVFGPKLPGIPVSLEQVPDRPHPGGRGGHRGGARRSRPCARG